MVGWRRRKQGEKRPTYVHGSSNFTCVIHYGGDFVMSPRMKYTSKRVANFDFVDVDTFSTFTLCEMVEKLIVDAPFAVYWRVPNAALSTTSVKPLKTDHDCIAMMNSLPDNRHIHIYMKPVRAVADEEVNEDLEDFNKEEEIYEEDHDDEEEVNEDEIHGAATGQEEAYVNEEEAEVYEDEEIHIDANEEDVAATATEEEKDDDIAASEEESDFAAAEEEVDDVEEEVNAATTEEEEGDTATEEEEEGDTATEEEVDVAEEEEDSEATEEFDVSDHEYDWAGDEKCRKEDGIGFRVQRNMDGFGPDGVNLNENDKEPESETDKSEDLYSDHGSDSDRPRYPEFNSDVDMEKPKFVKGLVFPNRTVLKEAIKQYGRVNRVEVKLKKNDKRRLQAICKEGCPWKLWAAPLNPKDNMDQTWQIKTMVNSHNCSKPVANRNITSKWMAKYYIGKFMSEPNYTMRSLVHDVLLEFGTLVSTGKCGRAREAALEMIEGNHKGQYGRIYDYLQELRSTNPGTTTICHLDARLFQRMYVCLQACKEGWKVGCRRIISLDGCFLKGYFQGYLLTAVGIDANDCIYPIAYAAVESENMSSWHWFLDILKTDLDIESTFSIAFMSDRQKVSSLLNGLQEAIEDLFPNAEDRKCVRHMYTNFKEKHKGQALKDAVWKAARATYLREFEDAMDQLKALSEAAYNWIKGKGPSQWSRSHFSTRSKCDMLLNNHCESFNKSILEARDKPILTMMETIRTKIMTRIVSKREAAEKCKGLLCGKIQKKLATNIEQSISYSLDNKCMSKLGSSGQPMLVFRNIKLKLDHLINMLWILNNVHVHAENETSLGSHVPMQHQSFD
ncbi:hypothetical protein GQ457_02G030690 [Hibiscus cannabinus]